MKRKGSGEAIVFFVSAMAIIFLIVVFYVVFRVSGRIENVIKEEKLNEQSLMLVDLLKSKLNNIEPKEIVESINKIVKDNADVEKFLNELKEKNSSYADFLVELYSLNIDVGKKSLVFKFVTSSLLKGVNNARVAVEYPNFIAQIDVGEIKYSFSLNPASINIPLKDGNLMKIKWHGAEK